MSTPPFLDPPPGTRAYRLPTARGELAVLDTSPPAGRPDRAPAVLVPGFTGSKEDFIAVLGTLSAAGHRAVALDLRGQHESPAAGNPDGEAAYSVDEFGLDVLAVIEALGDGPVHLLGHSFGGLVARSATLAARAAIRSLALLGSGPGPVPGASADRAALMLRALDQYDLPTIWEAMQAAYAADGNKPPADPEIGRFLRRRFLANSPACLRAIARQLLETPDRVGELAGTGVPMLVAHGVDDDAWPPELQAEMAERLGAHRVAIPGAAHSPAAEQPEQTAAALTGFWASAERAG